MITQLFVSRTCQPEAQMKGLVIPTLPRQKNVPTLRKKEGEQPVTGTVWRSNHQVCVCGAKALEAGLFEKRSIIVPMVVSSLVQKCDWVGGELVP